MISVGFRWALRRKIPRAKTKDHGPSAHPPEASGRASRAGDQGKNPFAPNGLPGKIPGLQAKHKLAGIFVPIFRAPTSDPYLGACRQFRAGGKKGKLFAQRTGAVEEKLGGVARQRLGRFARPTQRGWPFFFSS